MSFQTTTWEALRASVIMAGCLNPAQRLRLSSVRMVGQPEAVQKRASRKLARLVPICRQGTPNRAATDLPENDRSEGRLPFLIGLISPKP